MNATSEKESAFKIVSNQLAEAVAAPKCHKCGCLHKTVEALSGTEAGKNELAGASSSRGVQIVRRPAPAFIMS